LNDIQVVRRLLDGLRSVVKGSSSYYDLKFKPQYYMETPGGCPPEEAGWYVILEANNPLYVGKADDLAARLNSSQGSTDNFAKAARDSDPERNMIKKFDEAGLFQHLRVCVITEHQLLRTLNVDRRMVSDLDRGNIEKLLNIFRSAMTFNA